MRSFRLERWTHDMHALQLNTAALRPTAATVIQPAVMCHWSSL